MAAYGYPSIAALARDLGHERSETLSRIHRDSKAKPSVDLIADLSDKFADLNLDWFLTGKGEPRLPGPRSGNPTQSRSISEGGGMPRGMPSSEIEPGSVRFDLREPESKYVPMPVVSNREGEGRIIMLDSRVAAGFPGHAGDPEFLREQPVMHLPGFRYKGQGLIALQVSGDSMAPTIKHLDWLVARPLLEPDKEVVEGYVHILVTRDGCVAKRLFRAPRGRHAFICKSDNLAYPQYEQPVDGDERIYMALAILSEDLSNRANNVDLRLTALERDMLALQAQFKKR